MPTALLQDNGIQMDDHAAHGWYRFVLSFPPHLVGHYLEKFGIDRQHLVLDPFCGTGTTPVECKKRGIPSVGVEANPVAAFASRVKVNWRPSPDGLREHAEKVGGLARSRLEETGISDEVFFNNPDPDVLRKLSTESRDLLLTGSVSPLPLHKVLVLRDCMDASEDARFADHERLAFASTAVADASNLRFGPEVGVGKRKEDAAVVGPWDRRVKQICEDLRSLEAEREIPAQVLCADARDLSGALPARSVDFVFTSPPYPNEKDYTRTTRLELVLLGFVTNKAELRALKQTLVRSNTRGVYKVDRDDDAVASHAAIQRIAERIEARRQELGKTSGFERMYARVTKLYFGGMARHLEALRPLLKPGAVLAYVVGDQASYLRIMIRTGELLADIAQGLGYSVLDIDLFRTRFATATAEQLREEVVLLRWEGA